LSYSPFYPAAAVLAVSPHRLEPLTFCV